MNSSVPGVCVLSLFTAWFTVLLPLPSESVVVPRPGTKRQQALEQARLQAGVEDSTPVWEEEAAIEEALL